MVFSQEELNIICKAIMDALDGIPNLIEKGEEQIRNEIFLSIRSKINYFNRRDREYCPKLTQLFNGKMNACTTGMLGCYPVINKFITELIEERIKRECEFGSTRMALAQMQIAISKLELIEMDGLNKNIDQLNEILKS